MSSDRLHKIQILAFVILPLAGTVAAMALTWQRYVFPTDVILFAAMYALTGFGIGGWTGLLWGGAEAY